MPIYAPDKSGYIFVEILGYTDWNLANNVYAFEVLFEPYAHQYLKDGVVDNNLQIVVSMDWNLSTGTAHQNYAYNENTIISVINSYNADMGYYNKVFRLTINNSDYVDFDLDVVLVSGTNTKIVAGTR